MLKRMWLWALLVGAMMLPQAGMAQDKKEAKKDPKKDSEPTVLIRVQSVNELLKSGDYIASLLPEDEQEQLKQLLSTAKTLIDEKKGIEGVDVKNPIGFYATLDADDVSKSPVVGLIPIADEETFLALLKDRANLDVKKNQDGSYETTAPMIPSTLYFRFANGYCYVTTNDVEFINPKKLPKPADVLGGKAEHLISATFRIDRMPEQMRRLALGSIENMVAQAKEAPLPVEDKKIKEFTEKAVDEFVGTIKSIIEDGEQASLRINLNPQNGEIAFEIEMTGVKGSKLAKNFKSIQENKSVAGGAAKFDNSMFTLNFSVSTYDSLKKMLPEVMKAAVKEAKEKAGAPNEAEELVKPLLEALIPTFASGEFDAALTVTAPNKAGHISGLAAIKVKEGKKIEAQVKETVKKLPPEVAAVFELDKEKLVAGAMLHVVKLTDFAPPEVMKSLGSGEIMLTFRDDLALIAFGEDAKSLLKKALESKPADVGVFNLEFAVSKLAGVNMEDEKKAAELKKISEKIFGKNPAPGSDVIRFSITGGEGMKIKLAAQGKAIQFLIEAAKGAGEISIEK